MPTPKGYVCIVLHSHLPYVLGHGVWPFGSDWLCEAAAETYLPLLRALEGLWAEGLPARITIGLTPVLTEQLRDTRFPEIFSKYLEQKIEAAREDATAFKKSGHSHRELLARGWALWYQRAKDDFFTVYGGDIVGAFRRLQERGALEIITCGATHGYLPLLGTQGAVRGQVKLGVETYKRHFGRSPRGIWLPECAYRPQGPWGFHTSSFTEFRPGVEQVLAEHGLDHFVADAHLISGQKAVAAYTARFRPYGHKHGDLPLVESHIVKTERATARPGPARGAGRLDPRDASVLDVYRVENPEDGRGATVFVRDPEVALQVWSGEIGYPGDPAYLDFHKKHHPGGMRYWAVTGSGVDMADKLEYHPAYSPERVKAHARHFVEMCRSRLVWADQVVGEPATVTAPFDTELFGHWWFEGPSFLKEVLSLLAQDPDISTATMEERVASAGGELRALSLREGSWGEEGDHRVWLNAETEWSWPLLHDAERRLADLTRRAAPEDALAQRILRQMCRSIALLEASDWQFLIHMKSARSYAEERLRTHAADAATLGDFAERHLSGGGLSEAEVRALQALEDRDRLFPNVEPSWWT
jgi:1,4-alpha-glucan branching enzyme